jgi:hypothetical protein
LLIKDMEQVSWRKVHQGAFNVGEPCENDRQGRRRRSNRVTVAMPHRNERNPARCWLRLRAPGESGRTAKPGRAARVTPMYSRHQRGVMHFPQETRERFASNASRARSGRGCPRRQFVLLSRPDTVRAEIGRARNHKSRLSRRTPHGRTTWDVSLQSAFR